MASAENIIVEWYNETKFRVVQMVNACY